MAEHNLSARVNVVFDEEYLHLLRKWQSEEIYDQEKLNVNASHWVSALMAKRDIPITVQYHSIEDQGFLKNIRFNVKLKPFISNYDSQNNIAYFISRFEIRYKGVKEMKGNSGILKGNIALQIQDNDNKTVSDVKIENISSISNVPLSSTENSK